MMYIRGHLRVPLCQCAYCMCLFFFFFFPPEVYNERRVGLAEEGAAPVATKLKNIKAKGMRGRVSGGS